MKTLRVCGWIAWKVLKIMLKIACNRDSLALVITFLPALSLLHKSRPTTQG